MYLLIAAALFLFAATVGFIFDFVLVKHPIMTPAGKILLRDMEKISQELKLTDNTMAKEVHRIHEAYFNTHVSLLCLSSFFFLLCVEYLWLYLRHHH